ncbi:MAG: hypothetical protein ACI8QS_001801 [Planctomycetota bacterium]|jgi:hypothetical protein
MGNQDMNPTPDVVPADPEVAGGSSATSAGARRHERRSIDSALVLELNTDSVDGRADNVSRAGMMLYTDQPLKVTVCVEGINGGSPVTGRLVRLQRMDDTYSGVAIEFDELLDLDSTD